MVETMVKWGRYCLYSGLFWVACGGAFSVLAQSDRPPLECETAAQQEVTSQFVEAGEKRREIMTTRCRVSADQQPATAYIPVQDPGSFLEAFHAALYSNDLETVYDSFHPDALISEEGKLEDGLDSYIETHLSLEMDMLEALSRSYMGEQIMVFNGVAWATTTTRLHGTYEGRYIDVLQVETMVMLHGPDGWKIRQVHWSNRPNRGEVE